MLHVDRRPTGSGSGDLVVLITPVLSCVNLSSDPATEEIFVSLVDSDHGFEVIVCSLVRQHCSDDDSDGGGECASTEEDQFVAHGIAPCSTWNLVLQEYDNVDEQRSPYSGRELTHWSPLVIALQFGETH